MSSLLSNSPSGVEEAVPISTPPTQIPANRRESFSFPKRSCRAHQESSIIEADQKITSPLANLANLGGVHRTDSPQQRLSNPHQLIPNNRHQITNNH
ncbi:hypothetical protein [Fodinibius halophilus]|uniref:Uncharacterized protein n=1 Tax=Fodinibius halophilus TaxID=1736908 RepID=A0A6M1T1X6_9BACT|nr:hypothetical protein [Fodinibius halophilus]NGP88017.1 hypothetical protein [Fodinibius halophilus]